MLAILGCVPPPVIPENQLWDPPLRLSTRACYLGGTRMAVLTQSSQLLHELDPSSHLVTMRKQYAAVAYPTAHRSVGLCHHVSL